MSTWRTARLDEVAEVLGGGTPSRQEPKYFGGSIAWATPTDVTALGGLYISGAKESITEAGLKNSSTKLLPPGAVLLTSRATIGYTAVAKVPICTNQGFVNFICGPHLLPEYLAFWLRTQKDKMVQHAGGTTFKEIARGTLRKFEIPFPNINEQRRIVDLLSRAEGIVRLRHEAKKKAQAIIPALFLDMFGDPATNPKGWPRVVLEEVAAVGSGNGFPIIHQGKKSGRFPFYKVSDMNLPGNEVEMRRANNYINENDLQTLRARVFRPGTLIFPKIGAAIATNKKRVLTIEACFDNNVMGITPSKRLSSTFLHGLFLWKDISDFASDSNPPSIRKTTVETWEIQLPPNELQEQFAQRVSAIRSAQTLQASATEQAKGTFNSLLSQVFSEDRNSACTHEDEVTA
jgi:type I restriction enzyme S subunit